MHGFLRLSALLFSLPVALAACSPLQTLQHKKPQGSDFSMRLAAEYLAYATSEAEQGHKEDADHFARKGLSASRHQEVLPEPIDPALQAAKPKRWKMLNAARNRLLADMTEDVKRVSPQLAARTRLLFDCWVDQQEELGEEDIVVSCGREFSISVGDLEKSMYNLKPKASRKKRSS